MKNKMRKKAVPTVLAVALLILMLCPVVSASKPVALNAFVPAQTDAVVPLPDELLTGAFVFENPADHVPQQDRNEIPFFGPVLDSMMDRAQHTVDSASFV